MKPRATQSLVLGLAILILAGCSNPSGPSGQSTQSAQEAGSTSSNTPSGEGGGIAPMGGMAAGPMTPVAGSESLQGGGGSAAGNVLKDKAKGLAAQSPSSLNQAGSDED